jgi:hypothetical protein
VKKRWYLFAAGLIVLGLTFTCVVPRPARGPDAACPGADMPCLTERVCVFDRAGECEVCHCAPPAFYPPGQEPGAPGSLH